MIRPVIVLALTAVAGGLAAQESPYVRHQGRAIKALSPEEVEDLLNGRGMGFALAAELNGLPGPRHVLELADSLALTAEQRRRTQDVFDRMESRAIALGRELVAGEARLDSLFAAGGLRSEAMTSLVESLGTLRGRLRALHLGAHLEMMTVLSRHQVMMYGRLRGYGGHQGH